ncbi:MAG TPA: beta-ketoacyl synthase N-terminal-like domain-containing protein, partial [Steroidobacteraceae bacterium]
MAELVRARPQHLLILQSHCVEPAAGTRHFDGRYELAEEFLDAFDAQAVLDAEAFMLAAANAGLFPTTPPSGFPATDGINEVTLSHLEIRDYRVRLAAPGDLDALDRLEGACWTSQMRAPIAVLARRISLYPQGQFVMELDGKVVGAIYSQRIADIRALEGRTANDVLDLHHQDAPVIQLLAVNIEPQYQQRQCGDQLLEFMLQRCARVPGLDAVVAVTLCKNFHRQSALSIQEYIQQRDEFGSLVDPILKFHEDHGARVARLVPGYRPGDTNNGGYGVLVHYDVYSRKPKPIVSTAHHDAPIAQASAGKPSSEGHATGLNPAPLPQEAAHSQVWLCVEQAIRDLLGAQKANGFIRDRPLLEMGLDSLDLSTLRNRLSARFELEIPTTVFFDHNTAARLVSYLQERLPRPSIEVANPPPSVQACTALRADELAASPAGSDGEVRRHLSQGPHTDVAIVGIACRLPGGIDSPDELWNFLAEKRCAIGPLPEGRWSWPASIDPTPTGEHRGIDRGGFLSDLARFDPDFFRLSPKEAQLMDPQQRILLELTWQCLEDAGCSSESPSDRDTGVFIGASGSDYRLLLEQARVEVQAQMGTGNSMAILANRLSYFFDWRGPSLAIDTACSSSLVAVHHALQALNSGACFQALVGGVNVICHPGNTLSYYKAGMLSKDGLCRTFDARANGYVRSEGAVVLLLKPLARAVADCDRIYAVIKGSATNHGGQAGGLTAPSPAQQADL